MSVARLVRRYGTASDNQLVHGDNLDALVSLQKEFAGRVRCVYLDPPFNTGRTFAEYKDSRSSEQWTRMMRPRLEALFPLLADDGAVFAEIDDTQLAPLTLLLDDVFGAHQRISTITVVRSAATGHKAINRGPVHVSDFILAYAKDKKLWRYRPQVRVREGLDAAYSTWLCDPDLPREEWTFQPLRKAVALKLGAKTPTEALRALGRDGFEKRLRDIVLTHARHVVRFAQPRYEAVSHAAQQLILASRAEPARVFVLPREGRSPFILRGGNRLLFLADKVRVIAGAPAIVEPLTNVWTDVPFQGIAREGGVVFARNKKPERLISRILAMATDPGDWVLDPFVGSGTTAAVAHKMGRQWIGIDSGDHVRTLAEPRLARVVAGQDETGITKECGFLGGGGFCMMDMENSNSSMR
jgi:adenine-specific DNA-methyltransferase